MKRDGRDEALLVTIMALWGFNTVAVKLALREIDVLPLVAVRNVIVLTVIVSIFFFTRSAWTIRREDLPRLALLGLIGAAANQLLFNIGVRYTSAANGSLLMSISPIFGLIFGVLIFREVAAGRRWIGVIASMCGVFLIVTGGGGGLQFGIDSIGGDLLVLGAASAWSLYAVLSRPFLRRYSSLQVSLISWVVADPLIVGLAVGPAFAQDWTNISLLSWSMAIYSGVSVGSTNILFYHIVNKVGSSRALIFMYLVPVFGVIFAMLTLGETLSVLQITGGAVALFGVYFAQGSVATKPKSSRTDAL